MSTSPEERAFELANWMARHIIGEGLVKDSEDATCRKCVAAALDAIRTAENDALERVAERFAFIGLDKYAEQIRAFKHPDPPTTHPTHDEGDDCA